jgi:protein transport protein SEC20
MSFQTISERLTALQESNAQLKELIDRLATIKFQPGSIPLDNEEGNVMTELTSEIQQTLKDQDEDLELLQEDVYDLDFGRKGSELELHKDRLDQAVKRAIKELKV